MKHLIFAVSLLCAALASAKPSHHTCHPPRPVPHACHVAPHRPPHHTAHAGFGLGLFAGATVGTIISQVAQPQAIVVASPTPAPTTVIAAPGVVRVPVKVWVPGCYVDTLVNGVIIKVWQPGHYEWR